MRLFFRVHEEETFGPQVSLIRDRVHTLGSGIGKGLVFFGFGPLKSMREFGENLDERRTGREDSFRVILSLFDKGIGESHIHRSSQNCKVRFETPYPDRTKKHL